MLVHFLSFMSINKAFSKPQNSLVAPSIICTYLLSMYLGKYDSAQSINKKKSILSQNCDAILQLFWLSISMVFKNYVCKGQLVSEWIYKLIVSSKNQTKNCKDFCPVSQGRNPCNFSFVCWKKRWVHKFILKLTDL